MKKFALMGIAALTLGTLTFVSLPISALADQAAPTPPPATQDHQGRGHGGMMKKLAEALNLTDAQKAQIKPIVKDARTKTKAIRDDATLSKPAMKQQVKAVNDKMWKDIEAVLTPDQITKLNDLRAKQKAEQKHHKAKNG